MAISQEAYKALEAVVGPAYISQDPVECIAYNMDKGGFEAGTGFCKVMVKTPGCIIHPRTAEEVQKIVRICNRYQVAYKVGSSFWIVQSFALTEDCLIIDLKCMNKMEIDEKHMYATVEPGVIYSQLQELAMKHGLYTTTPGGGSQVSVIPNHLYAGLSPLNYRNSYAPRRILGGEWILPDGEIVRFGSLATQDDPFWGEGLGPDLVGAMRMWHGGLGIVTKMAVKLFPFQPERPEPVGISPDTGLALPPRRMRWLNFTLPDRDSLARAMREIANAEIAAAVTKVPVFWRAIAKAKTKEDFWAIWSRETEDSIKNTHILRVLLIGYTSEDQMDYEERILMDIVREFGGEGRRTKPTDESWIKNADSAGMWLMTGGYVSVEYILESLQHCIRLGETIANFKSQFDLPLMPDYNDPGWFQMTDLGHMGYVEFLVYWDPFEKEEEVQKIDRWYIAELPKELIRKRFYQWVGATIKPIGLTGPHYGPNYHEFMLRVKRAIDPANLSAPPTPLERDVYVEKAEWLHSVVDWEAPKL
ncbi:MAG TPA: FAD-binding oxidoreductase [Dehalococcoidia bacterium]|nr:FAD-binding oxidoreductase [Dehalococcoidia bacterium]